MMSNYSTVFDSGGEFNDPLSDSYDFSDSVKKDHSAKMVVMEMSLSLTGILANLIVIIAIREKESLLNSTGTDLSNSTYVVCT